MDFFHIKGRTLISNQYQQYIIRYEIKGIPTRYSLLLSHNIHLFSHQGKDQLHTTKSNEVRKVVISSKILYSFPKRVGIKAINI